ncbi:MAG: sodium:solute symporter family protein [Clostridia bacterium]|nr:sodium:solute symporter family protein [Clostridia bacterium]
MTIQHMIGLTVTLVAIVALSIYSGKAVKKNKEANSWIVAGVIMGTLVGGSSTVGTAQLAYNYGMSAWWWTLGAGIACLILAVMYVKPLRKSGSSTLLSIISTEYGTKTGFLASVLSSLGSFINIISQLIAATAIIAVVFPKLSLALSLFISAIFMTLYIIFGGTKGSGMVGILKMVLLYVAMMACGIMVLCFSGGFSGFLGIVERIENPENVPFFSLFARGIGTDLGACFSLIVGVIATQSYAQGIFAAKSTKEAKKGALLSALLVPPVGIGGILVGLYMRSVHPGIVAKTALTMFVTEYMPPLFSGVVLATLFIAVLGTGAGLALGIATVLRNDVIPTLTRKNPGGVTTERILIVAILFSACLLSMGPLGDTILNFAFMSMGLRGATIFVPLCCAFWYSGKVDRRYAFSAIILGPVLVLIFGVWKVLPFDPLFIGIFASCIISLAGIRKTPQHT